MECGGFSLSVTRSSKEQQRLAVIIERLLLLSQIIIEPAHVGEHAGFPNTVTFCSIEWQRLAVVLQCLLLLSKIIVDSSDAVERGNFSFMVARSVPVRQRLFHFFNRLLQGFRCPLGI